ncbi:MAG: YceI family protein [Crocinitomicaceae bacterium]|nr:YceI family protein [Crocinitomicaceae bacterium]
MKKSILTLAITLLVGASSLFAQETKLVNKNGHISFFSHTAIEDIEAHNYKVTSTVDMTSGAVVFSVPMQSYEFEKAAMQKHYNSPKFLDTKTYPKSKFVGKITNLSDVNFSTDGTYNVTIDGELTMHGVTKSITASATIVVKGAKITLTSELKVTLADYKIAFEDGKPSTNIAKTIDITVNTEYSR